MREKILEALRKEGRELNAHEVAYRTGISRSSCQRVLPQMARDGLIRAERIKKRDDAYWGLRRKSWLFSVDLMAHGVHGSWK